MIRSRWARASLLALYHGGARWLPPTRGPGGRLWAAARRAVVVPLLASAGRGINIEHGANIGKGAQLSVGSRSSVGINASLHGPVRIGDDVMMGPEVMVFALGHATDRWDVPMIDQGFAEPDPVEIGDDVWIGARAILLPGVRVGRGAVVGAGAVVARDVPPCAVVVGNPARVVSFRDGRPVAGREAVS